MWTFSTLSTVTRPLWSLQRFGHLFGLLVFFMCLFGGISQVGYARDLPDSPLKIAKLAQFSQQSHEGAVLEVQTDTPRKTIESFLHLRSVLEQAFLVYAGDRTLRNADRIISILSDLRSLIDLADIPSATRRHTGNNVVGYLLDGLGRVDLTDLSAVPDEAQVDNKTPLRFRIPGTPLFITRVSTGSRTGEFLFDKHTRRIAPKFYQAVETVPLNTTLPIKSWTKLFPQLTGPLVPVSLVEALPESSKVPLLDTPVWKVFLTFLALLLFVTGIVRLHRWALRIKSHGPWADLVQGVLTPIAMLAGLALFDHILDYQLIIAGRLQNNLSLLFNLTFYATLAWGFWLLVVALFDGLLIGSMPSSESLDANMFRLIARIVGVVGAVTILAYGLQALGVPVFSLLAGLGIGGLAIALAIRPTLENLIGGFVLFIDKPVRIGDYCSFGDKEGTVEKIGVRSTQIRALDRTLISIPNSQFVDMQLINWARCDQMMITHIIGLRLETDDDQLRYVLARIREMFHSHPRIDPDTIRVRFAGYGASSLDIDVRVYAKTREWNDFYAIKEDVLLRISGIVRQAGTGIAFPSQTVYLGKDEGLDRDAGKNATKEVAAWRRKREFPFPKFSATRLDQLKDSLRYPPPGSPDFLATEEELSEGAEQLSIEPLQSDPAETEKERD